MMKNIEGFHNSNGSANETFQSVAGSVVKERKSSPRVTIRFTLKTAVTPRGFPI